MVRDSTKPPYLEAVKGKFSNVEGRTIELWKLVPPGDPSEISDWARRFRQNYCLDSDIDALRFGTGKSRAEYLREIVFPAKCDGWGPAVRAGDFAELLVCDYLEYLKQYLVPRGKYAEKASRNESVKGTDVVGFRVAAVDNPSPSDELIAFEVKSRFSTAPAACPLQRAIDGSSGDYIRLATTLNAIKRRLKAKGDSTNVHLVTRFQNPTDRPYLFISGAAAVLTDDVFDSAVLSLATAAGHTNAQTLKLLVIKGADLMALTHAIYDRAADEA